MRSLAPPKAAPLCITLIPYYDVPDCLCFLGVVVVVPRVGVSVDFLSL